LQAGNWSIIRDRLNVISKERKDLLRLHTDLGRYTVKMGFEKGTLKGRDADKITILFNTFQKGTEN
jgi:hypothetical protein